MVCTDLIVTAEDVKTGKRRIGYVCCCRRCRTPEDFENFDKSRPTGLLTHPNRMYTNVRVYTDTLVFASDEEKEKAVQETTKLQDVEDGSFFYVRNGDWIGFVQTEDGEKICYAGVDKDDPTGNYVRRFKADNTFALDIELI